MFKILKAMQRKVFFVAIIFSLSVFQFAFSQNSTSDDSEFLAANDSELEELEGESWAFYSDDENQILYIDFENLKVNLNDIIVKDENGKVVLKDDVFDLPLNTIYELDLNQYGNGNYEVELRSFTGVIRKTVAIK